MMHQPYEPMRQIGLLSAKCMSETLRYHCRESLRILKHTVGLMQGGKDGK
jgi:hypothetical protein